ncbi:MAG: hypothetical protein CL678_11475 [Bdellovibrionaceae bacterium]|nr:hypothetical protein [Pseudobdellovibrionaceae bacterium]|tara:strand:+ start:1037 stop:1852 length:816 start_codon:yes stop_codon:yes gene_type:complete
MGGSYTTFAPFFKKTEIYLEWSIFLSALFTAVFWVSGKGLFYSETDPVMSPFTSVSLLILVGCRLAEKKLVGWSHPMSLALIGMVACGNASSIIMLLTVPELIFAAAPEVVATSILTSFGLICFCIYEIFILLRKSPQRGLLIDDIFLHLALMPGALSLLGLVLEIPIYRGIGVDPRAGIGFMEMFFMGAFAIYAVVSNPDLFMWSFLSKSMVNRVVFALLFMNQYVAPIIVGLIFTSGTHSPGIEFFVLLAGFLATLSFLTLNAVRAVEA